jgi:hypothetical protein
MEGRVPGSGKAARVPLCMAIIGHKGINLRDKQCSETLWLDDLDSFLHVYGVEALVVDSSLHKGEIFVSMRTLSSFTVIIIQKMDSRLLKYLMI